MAQSRHESRPQQRSNNGGAAGVFLRPSDEAWDSVCLQIGPQGTR